MGSFEEVAVEQGWDLDSQVEVLLDFVREHSSTEELGRYAQYRAELENEQPHVVVVEIDRSAPRRFPGRDEGVESVSLR